VSAYDSSTICRARELHAAGWGVADICRIIRTERGVQPARSTVHYWVNDDFAERRRTETRVQKRKRIASTTSGSMRSNHRTVEFRIARMRALDQAGLSMESIAKVMALDFPDEPLTSHQVKGAVRHGRTPRTLRAAA